MCDGRLLHFQEEESTAKEKGRAGKHTASKQGVMEMGCSLFDEDDINELHFPRILFPDEAGSCLKGQPIKCVNGNVISPSIFRERYRNKTPVLLSQHIACWKAVREWENTEYLKSLLNPQREVKAFVAKDNRSFLDNEEVTEKVPLRIEQLITTVFEFDDNFHQTRYYYRDLLEYGLYEDIEPGTLWNTLIEEPREDEESKKDTPHLFNHSLMRIWLGTAGNTTPLHFDRCHGLLCQIVGTKQVTLFSPEDTRNLYPHDGVSTKSHCAKVSLHAYHHPDSAIRKKERDSYPKFIK